jgi:hypothetical protein
MSDADDASGWQMSFSSCQDRPVVIVIQPNNETMPGRLGVPMLPWQLVLMPTGGFLCDFAPLKKQLVEAVYHPCEV